jgi:transposase
VQRPQDTGWFSLFKPLKPVLASPVPELTARVARAAFPKGNPYLRLRDELGHVFHDGDFADLYPRRGQPALSPWKLALVTVMQFAEDLSDRQAADAVRGRIDWKYALGLELDDPGFHFSVLSEFRGRPARSAPTSAGRPRGIRASTSRISRSTGRPGG